MVDVRTEAVIHRPRAEVAGYAADLARLKALLEAR
jgi:hypothetical protein